MKKYIVILLATASIVSSCFEPNNLENDLPDPAVYFIKNGYQESQVFYDVQESVTVPVYAYCSGYKGGDAEVLIYKSEFSMLEYNEANGTSLKALPENCYTIDAMQKKMVDKKATFNVTFDCGALRNLSQKLDFSDLKSYVIPLVMKPLDKEYSQEPKKEGQTMLFLTPSMKQMAFIFTQAGTQDLEYSNVISNNGKIYLYYDVYTPVDNKWDCGVKFNFNTSGADGKYIPLPENSYQVNSTASAFSEGISEIQYEVIIDESLAQDVFYTIQASVESTGNFVISGDNTSVINLFNRISYPQNKINIESCNSYQNDTYSPEKMLDGNPETFWHCAYNATQVGVYGNVDFEIVVKLAESKSISAYSILRRSGNYATDLKAGYVEFSTDGLTFTNKTPFVFGTAQQFSGSGPLYVVCNPTDTQYIKIVCTESNRFAAKVNKLANIAEFNVFYK